MFRQLARTQRDARELFQYNPLLISALVEAGWRKLPRSPFDAWPAPITTGIVESFFFPEPMPPFLRRFINLLRLPLDHLVHAYLIENTGIYGIFYKVMEARQSGEQLAIPSDASEQFWRVTENLIYSDPLPTTIWNLTSRARPDETSLRMSAYWRLLGLDLAHADEIALNHPYQKAAAANEEFIRTFECFAREIWIGICNRRNTSGANCTDDAAIATTAERIHDMMCTRRQHGNLAREEFRAVALMSWLHLAVSFDSPVVVDLRATACSPEQRLFKIAERVGMTAHPNSKAFFDLAHPLSILLRAVETGIFNNPTGAQMLYRVPFLREISESVIEQYSLAMQRNLKAMPESLKALPPPALASGGQVAVLPRQQQRKLPSPSAVVTQYR